MTRYPKLFIAMSMLYLLGGVSMGVITALGWGHPLAMRFTHIHINLLGFVCMIIFGVGYHVLPRFFANDIPWPRLVPIHFWLQNIGLIGLIGAYWLLVTGRWGNAQYALVSFGMLTAFSIVLFVVNIMGSLIAKTPERIVAARKVVAAKVPRPVMAQMKVSEALARGPAALEYFLSRGFHTLANPISRAAMAPLVTIEAACRKHGIRDIQGFVDALNLALGVSINLPATSAIRHVDGLVHEGMIIGDVLSRHPRTREVFQQRFGEGCFTCPGQPYESIEQAAKLHGVNPEHVVTELNACIVAETAEAKSPEPNCSCC